MATAIDTTELRTEPLIVHGCIPHRRRETAILGQQPCAWKLRRLNINHATDLKDITDAFASADWQSLTGANESIMRGDDVVFGRQRFRFAAVTFGDICVRPSVGGIDW
eukprot:1312401-Pyramimonas_sp.AAC.1